MLCGGGNASGFIAINALAVTHGLLARCRLPGTNPKNFLEPRFWPGERQCWLDELLRRDFGCDHLLGLRFGEHGNFSPRGSHVFSFLTQASLAFASFFSRLSLNRVLTRRVPTSRVPTSLDNKLARRYHSRRVRLLHTEMSSLDHGHFAW